MFTGVLKACIDAMLLAAPQFHQKHLCHVTLQSRLTQGPHQNHLYDSTAYGILSVSLL